MTKYTGSPGYRHDTPECTGILLANLGTPDAPTTTAVRRYLAEFLWDPRVIELPRLIWWPILHGIILRLRPRRSAEAYAKIWSAGGSPLLVNTRRLADALYPELAEALGSVHVEVGMRYGNPPIRDALRRLRDANAQRLLVLPLYPQYSATTTAAVFDAVVDELRRWRWLPELRMVRNYHDNPVYIEALAASVRECQQRNGTPGRLLFSFHGIPQHYFLAGDPYFCECHKTARLVAQSLSLPDSMWSVSFQSRLGPRKWLQPYTDTVLSELPRAGVDHVQVICPGFSSDCLETLEEVQLRYRAQFEQAGGKRFIYISALNDRPDHVAALKEVTRAHCANWGQPGGSAGEQELARRASRARSLGAPG